MDLFVIVATKGRPDAAAVLMHQLFQQTQLPEHVVVVGSEAADVKGLADLPYVGAGLLTVITAAVGASVQRNAGLDWLAGHTKDKPGSDWGVVFFDDDFRPRADWLENCARAFQADPHLMGASGQVLADGVTSQVISEADAQRFLGAELAALPHAWSGATARQVPDLYGCNMAYRGSFASRERLDANLPFYSWLEDVDYSCRAARHGSLRYLPDCQGVHLGSPSGRTSGVRFGYSQVANPFYLYRKGSVPLAKCRRVLLRNVASNVTKTVLFNRTRDYPGRLFGNLLAAFDILRMKSHPKRILDL
ncbi:MAG TPA: glycosyltransferase family 2 protein [Hydrogenophaga sp.]